MSETRTFVVRALWDVEAKVYVSESDIKGLHIEAETLDEFEKLIFEHAIDLIVANHMPRSERRSKSIRDLIPGIVWERPREEVRACA